jgi:hypothetical protein
MKGKLKFLKFPFAEMQIGEPARSRPRGRAALPAAIPPDGAGEGGQAQSELHNDTIWPDQMMPKARMPRASSRFPAIISRVGHIEVAFSMPLV